MHLQIPEQLAGQRLDRALSALVPDVSRSRIQRWIDDGRVSWQGGSHRAKPARRSVVQAGDGLVVEPVFEAVLDPKPEPIKLMLLHEDADCLVVNKPPGLVVHPGAGNPSGTLLNALLHLDAKLEAVPRAGLVHRLDKDTSGALLVARTPRAHHVLTRALERREIKRDYQALVWGRLIAGGTVDAPISRHPTDRTRFHVHRGVGKVGRDSVTHYRVAERFAAHTLLDLSLETGRTHQIRVHMQHIAHPLVGDPVYGRRGQRAAGISQIAQDALLSFKRQALHARRLRFAHPTASETVDVVAPVPGDMAALLAAMREPQSDQGPRPGDQA